MSRSLAVIVPLYNDVGNVTPFFERARSVIDALPAIDWRIVFVNNGSTDRTRLKRVCPNCAKLIRPEWNICPYCAKDFDERDWTVHTGGKDIAAVGEKASTT